MDVIANIWSDFSLETKMRDAYRVSVNSTDRSTKNGAILVCLDEVVCHGWNHHSDGYGLLDEHHDRPLKYAITEHAERDVIVKAARNGISTSGLTMVANWVSCPDCARAIVLAGLVAVVCHKECMDRTPERWADMVNQGLEILKQGGVEVIQWSGKVDSVPNLNSGEVWYP